MRTYMRQLYRVVQHELTTLTNEVHTTSVRTILVAAVSVAVAVPSVPAAWRVAMPRRGSLIRSRSRRWRRRRRALGPVVVPAGAVPLVGLIRSRLVSLIRRRLIRRCLVSLICCRRLAAGEQRLRRR